jgi:hypothetical protein
MRFYGLLISVAMMALAPAAFAQQSSSPKPPAISTGHAESKTTAAPVPGKNSFTEAEARRRLESFGYSDVSGLHQDGQSVWRATAKKNGQPVQVGLDYQGNIVSQ